SSMRLMISRAVLGTSDAQQWIDADDYKVCCSCPKVNWCQRWIARVVRDARMRVSLALCWSGSPTCLRRVTRRVLNCTTALPWHRRCRVAFVADSVLYHHRDGAENFRMSSLPPLATKWRTSGGGRICARNGTSVGTIERAVNDPLRRSTDPRFEHRESLL